MLARIKSYETKKKMHFSSGKMKGFWQLLNKLRMNWGIFWVIHRFSLHAQPSCWYFYAAGILGMAGNYLGFCITWNPHTCAHKFVMSVLSIIRPQGDLLYVIGYFLKHYGVLCTYSGCAVFQTFGEKDFEKSSRTY